LFVVIGLEFLRINFSWDTTVAAIGAIIIVIVARWISVIIPVACLARFRKFSFNVLIVMTWGGLRGGISIALALSIQSSHQHNFIVAITYAVVLFSMMVQGVTIGPLIRRMRRGTDPKYTEEELPEAV
jgi:CPA1 family monovalent cation:H+ antiporter